MKETGILSYFGKFNTQNFCKNVVFNIKETSYLIASQQWAYKQGVSVRNSDVGNVVQMQSSEAV
jgi:hypothetical protein